jgi:hypothetical protein
LVGTPRRCDARIRGASIGIIANYGSILATQGCAASIGSAIAVVVASDGGMLATKSSAAGISCTSVGVIAVLEHGEATICGVAIRNVAFVATAGDLSVEASSCVGAAVAGAGISVIATDGCVFATAISRTGIANVQSAHIAIITSNVGVLASDIGGH